MKKQKKKCPFIDFLDSVGDEKIARQLGVTPKTLYNWRRLISFPPAKTMRRLRDLSKGKLTYEMIIDRG